MRDETVLLPTTEVAERLGVTRQRVLELITEGRLPARKVGRAYIVRAGDVDTLELRKVGRPPKPKDEATQKAERASRKRGAKK